MNARFTIDGGPELEAHLDQVCHQVRAGVQKLVPRCVLEGLVLGGGYGRGEGGVLRVEGRERPYNDIEFYAFLQGHRLLNDWTYRDRLTVLGEELSPQAGLHVEFKIDSLANLRSGTVSMFSYDLLAGHKIIAGGERLFEGAGHHLRAEAIPLSEATRLLFNRCTGLLLARELLDLPELKAEHRDFVERNISKAALAVGDALLVAKARYHWSCLERDKRLLELGPNDFAALPAFEQIQQLHRMGTEFKLHPRVDENKPKHEVERDYRAVLTVAEPVWLWIESRRLGQEFATPRDYCEWTDRKCPEKTGWQNWLLTWRSFGWKAALGQAGGRYPRERLLNTLPLLLWNSSDAACPETRKLLQCQLQTKAADWKDLVKAYKTSWPAYG